MPRASRELLKNAFRSTVERHLSRQGGELPHVAVELQQGDIHVIFKISDQGGGMPKRLQREAWQYGWTTVGGRTVEAFQYAEESCSWERGANAAHLPGALGLGLLGLESWLGDAEEDGVGGLWLWIATHKAARAVFRWRRLHAGAAGPWHGPHPHLDTPQGWHA